MCMIFLFVCFLLGRGAGLKVCQTIFKKYLIVAMQIGIRSEIIRCCSAMIVARDGHWCWR